MNVGKEMLTDIALHIIEHDATLYLCIFQQECQAILGAMEIKHHWFPYVMSLSFILSLDLIKFRVTHFQQHNSLWKKVQQELSLTLSIRDNHSSLLSQHLINIIDKPFIYHFLYSFIKSNSSPT